MHSPIHSLFVSISSNHPDQLGELLQRLGPAAPAAVTLEIRLRVLAAAIGRDNPRHLAQLAQHGWLEGHVGALHPLVMAASRRKTRSVEWILEQGHAGNGDIVLALAESVARSPLDRVDRRREHIHQLLLERLQRRASETSPWHLLLACLLDTHAGWLCAAHESITPHLFTDPQHEQFLAIWPRPRPGPAGEPDMRASRWLLEEGLDPERAARKAPFWRRLAEPFLARRQTIEFEFATACVGSGSRGRGRL